MKRILFVAIGVLIAAAAVLFIFFPSVRSIADIQAIFDGREPDLPPMWPKYKGPLSKEEFMLGRAEHFGLLRGLRDDDVDPQSRLRAVDKMEEQERDVLRRPDSPDRDNLLAAWTAIGPNPIPNAQVVQAPTTTASGRVISIAVHPTNPDIVYVGAAQGGLYRSVDGGANWTPLLDGALSLAIGSIAISPSQPETVYVGTGEANFSSDSFFGVGVYRIDNASTSADVSGPFNRDTGNVDVMTGRAIGRVIVHPTDPNTIFVATATGIGGISGASNSILPARGIYRSTNALSANPTFARLTGLAGNVNASVRDIEIDPQNPNVMVANVINSGGSGGIYRSANALNATASNVTFTQTQVFNSSSTSELTAEFVSIRPTGSSDATFYAAVGNLGGRVLRSTDGGVTWTQQIDNDFCTPQCFYDIAIGIDPTNANRVYLGGSPNLAFGISTNGGTSFTPAQAGLHVDSHAIAVAPSDPTRVYFGSDGGIYRSNNSGATWTSLNNSQFLATQFMGLAIHPTNDNYTIGGTQDNGTNYYSSTGTWLRVDGGDGGYAVIDTNAADLTNVRMYHTYFNQSNNVIGYATRATTPTAVGGWTFRGCNGSTPGNGMTCADTVLFYAPLEQGPGNPNTIYYGTDRVYRSADTGLTHTVVSQAPIEAGVAVSAIGISPTNDNVRVIGLRNGGLWGTTTGSGTLTNLDPSNAVPNGFIARAVIDPTDQNTAYVTVSAFGVGNVYKTTNLNAGVPTWTPAFGTGANTIPQVPVSGFVIDPSSPNRLFAGTDIGVYTSIDGGANWTPFGTGLPRVAVFDIAITNGPSRKVRVATHGKGMYEIPLTVNRVAPADFDGDGRSDLSVYRNSTGTWFWQNSSNGEFRGASFGIAEDKAVPGDYDGDGKADLALFRPSTGTWWINRSNGTGVTAITFGFGTDQPVQGDYDGDGRTDIAIFRPSNGQWWRFLSSSSSVAVTQFGQAGDKPVPGDYDGDGRTDIAVYRPSEGKWYLLRSSGGVNVVTWGIADDLVVPADYDGDGRTDIAVFRPSNGNWFSIRSTTGIQIESWGAAGDIPVQGDYDGDGRADVAIFRPSDGNWYRKNSATGGISIIPYGVSGDKPIPSAYVPVQ